MSIVFVEAAPRDKKNYAHCIINNISLSFNVHSFTVTILARNLESVHVK